MKEWGEATYLTLLTFHVVVVIIWCPRYFWPYQGIFTQIMETLSELCDLTNDGGHHSTELHQIKKYMTWITWIMTYLES